MTVALPSTEVFPANDRAVLAELWISFSSLLRSHLGALQTSGRLAQATFASLDASAIEVVDLSRTLRITSPVESGRGEWMLTRMGEVIARGPWQLHADAAVTLDGHHEPDMELGVEAFARKLWARASQEPAIARSEG